MLDFASAPPRPLSVSRHTPKTPAGHRAASSLFCLSHASKRQEAGRWNHEAERRYDAAHALLHAIIRLPFPAAFGDARVSSPAPLFSRALLPEAVQRCDGAARFFPLPVFQARRSFCEAIPPSSAAQLCHAL